MNIFFKSLGALFGAVGKPRVAVELEAPPPTHPEIDPILLKKQLEDGEAIVARLKSQRLPNMKVVGFQSGRRYYVAVSWSLDPLSFSSEFDIEVVTVILDYFESNCVKLNCRGITRMTASVPQDKNDGTIVDLAKVFITSFKEEKVSSSREVSTLQ